MPKTNFLGLHVLASKNDPIKEFVESQIEGLGTAESPLSDPQKIDKAIYDLDSNKQSKLTAGFGIAISEDGIISLALDNASEGEY